MIVVFVVSVIVPALENVRAAVLLCGSRFGNRVEGFDCLADRDFCACLLIFIGENICAVDIWRSYVFIVDVVVDRGFADKADFVGVIS